MSYAFMKICPSCSGVHSPEECSYSQFRPPVVHAQPVTGWVCPVCGGGVSPVQLRCPCKGVTAAEQEVDGE